jgi:single-stranded-DNA-specific exonuclease
MLIERRQVIVGDALQSALPPLMQRIYAARNVVDPSELQLELADLLPPDTLAGMSQATQLLWDVLQQQGRILIISDFDADGATSCALVLRALRQLGFQNLDYIVPDRFIYGYGLSPEIAELAVARQPDLVITVDNGISSQEGVARVRAAGIKVLITDHHLPGEQTPDANAVLNPNQNGCEFASKALAGVGVAFYLMLGLRAFLRQKNWFAEQNLAEPRLADLLDLVALGTVADLVPLDRNNRILVNEGLRRIRAGRACPGILAILDRAKRSRQNLVAADLGFVVGPRLNAAGRLEDMARGIDCLLCDDETRARSIASELDRVNDQRKRIEGEMREQAMASLERMQADLYAKDQSDLPAALCLYDPQWHQGVVGILASRVKEALHRPVFVFADAEINEEGERELKGSARSIPGLHIRDLLDTLAARNPGMITRFGGHAMAAGLSLPLSQFDRFRQAVTDGAASLLDEETLQHKLFSDGDLSADELNMETACLLRDAGPWGQAFPEPLFDGEFFVVNQRLLGDKHLKLLVSADEGRTLIDAIAFNVDTRIWPDPSHTHVRLAYRLDINEYRGQKNIQLMVEYLCPL